MVELGADTDSVFVGGETRIWTAAVSIPLEK